MKLMYIRSCYVRQFYIIRLGGEGLPHQRCVAVAVFIVINEQPSTRELSKSPIEKATRGESYYPAPLQTNGNDDVATPPSWRAESSNSVLSAENVRGHSRICAVLVIHHQTRLQLLQVVCLFICVLLPNLKYNTFLIKVHWFTTSSAHYLPSHKIITTIFNRGKELECSIFNHQEQAERNEITNKCQNL